MAIVKRVLTFLRLLAIIAGICLGPRLIENYVRDSGVLDGNTYGIEDTL